MEEFKADSDFDLSTLIDDLPAARFFWYNKVSDDQRPRYLQVLATLYQLFITPHFIPAAPYTDCSYLKKAERIGSRDMMWYLNLVISILRYSGNPELLISNKVRLIWSSQNGFSQMNEITEEHENVILKWYQTTWFTMLIMGVRVKGEWTEDGEFPNHATFLVLRKTRLGSVQYMYIDSEGFTSQKTSYERQYRLQTELERYVNYILGPNVRCENVLEECPALQLLEQGGNCVQWSVMMMALLVSQPDLFDNFRATLYKVSLYPTINIHLFTLSVFLRTLPQVGLLTYIRETIVPDLFNRKVFYICQEEDWETRAAVLDQFGVPNCYRSRECKPPCVQSGRRCMFRTSSNGVTFLTPKELATKMLHLYAEIWDMTGHSPNSMTKEQIEAQLDFPDYVKREEDDQLFKDEFDITDADEEYREELLNE